MYLFHLINNRRQTQCSYFTNSLCPPQTHIIDHSWRVVKNDSKIFSSAAQILKVGKWSESSSPALSTPQVRPWHNLWLFEETIVQKFLLRLMMLEILISNHIYNSVEWHEKTLNPLTFPGHMIVSSTILLTSSRPPTSSQEFALSLSSFPLLVPSAADGVWDVRVDSTIFVMLSLVSANRQ